MTVDRVARTDQALLDILDVGELAAALVGRGRRDYDGDRLLHLAAEAIIARIGEAVARLDPAFVDGHPDVPFRAAKGMRNLVAHEYHRVDPALVWGVLANRVPALCAQIEQILDAGPGG